MCDYVFRSQARSWKHIYSQLFFFLGTFQSKKIFNWDFQIEYSTCKYVVLKSTSLSKANLRVSSFNEMLKYRHKIKLN